MLMGQFPLLQVVYTYFVTTTGTNKDYFQVVLTVVAILTTYLIFNLQRSREKRKQKADDLLRIEESNKQYYSQREMDFSAVRPLFMVNKDQNKGEIVLFMKGREPITNVKIYHKLIISDDEEELGPTVIGNANKGDVLFQFQLKETEMIVISCSTFLGEQIYFIYFIGDSMFHFREIIYSGDFKYSNEILNRPFLSDVTENVKDNKFEIYRFQVKYSYLFDLPQLMFSKMLHKGAFREYLSSDNTQDYNLRLVLVIEMGDVSQLFSESIRFVREFTDMDIETTSELLSVLVKYLSDSWYIVGDKVGNGKYYFRDKVTFSNQENQRYYEEKFLQEDISEELIVNYMQDLREDVEKYRKINEYYLRVLEVYFRDYVKMSPSRQGYDNEIDTVLRNVRNDLRKILVQFKPK